MRGPAVIASEVIAVDPGPERSALVVWNGSVLHRLYGHNLDVLHQLKRWQNETPLVIEKVASFGMPVGAEVFETVYWSGRFAEAYGAERTHRITRIDVKNHLCHSSRAKDSNIRQALIDRFGPPGTKAKPGLLYGLSGDVWSALAVAVTWWDRQHKVSEVSNGA
jgi:hypothetical protein